MPDKEIIHLPSAGSIPGLPGQHGPGVYEVDWASRTLRRLVDGMPVDEPAEESDVPAEQPQPEPEHLHIEEQITIEPIPAPEPAPAEPPAAPEPEPAPTPDESAEPAADEQPDA